MLSKSKAITILSYQINIKLNCTVNYSLMFSKNKALSMWKKLKLHINIQHHLAAPVRVQKHRNMEKHAVK